MSILYYSNIVVNTSIDSSIKQILAYNILFFMQCYVVITLHAKMQKCGNISIASGQQKYSSATVGTIS